jgi:hypothetical protein
LSWTCADTRLQRRDESRRFLGICQFHCPTGFRRSAVLSCRAKGALYPIEARAGAIPKSVEMSLDAADTSVRATCRRKAVLDGMGGFGNTAPSSRSRPRTASSSLWTKVRMRSQSSPANGRIAPSLTWVQPRAPGLETVCGLRQARSHRPSHGLHPGSAFRRSEDEKLFHVEKTLKP